MKFKHLAKGTIILIAVFSLFLSFSKNSYLNNYWGISFEVELIFLVIVQISLFLLSIINSLTVDRDKLSFQIVSQALFLAYSLPAPLLVILSEDIGNIVQEHYDVDSIIGTYYLFILMQIGMVIGASLKTINIRMLNKSISTKGLIRSGWMLFTLSLIPLILAVLKGDWRFDSEYIELYNMMQNPTLLTKLAIFANFILLFPLSWLIIVSIQQKKKSSLLIIILCILFLTILKPSRGLILSMLIIGFLSYHYYVKRVSFKRMFVFASALMMLSFFILFYRATNEFDRGGLFSKVSEGYSIYENTFLVFNHTNSTGEYRWGGGYFDIILKLFPKRLNPFDLDDPLPRWLLKEYFPQTMEIGGGRMFSIVADGYINFGYAGPVMLGILFSVILKSLYFSMKRTIQLEGRFTFGILLYFFICSQMYYFIRGDLASFIIRLETYMIIPIGVLILIETLIPRRIYNVDFNQSDEKGSPT